MESGKFPGGHGMGEKILLVDDEEGIRKVVGLAIRDMGHETLVAASGAQALDVFDREAPSIVITDLRMPGMDGLELLRRIKAASPDTEVIIITGHGDMELAVGGLKLGAADFIHKPLDPDALEVAIDRAAEKISLRRRMDEYTRNLEHLAKEQAGRIVEMERNAAASQAIEGVTNALCGLADDIEGGRDFFNEMPCFVSIHDRAGKVVSVNAHYRERLGDMSGRPGHTVYAQSEGREENCPVVETLRTGKGFRGRETMVDATGAELPVIVHTAPIRGADGETQLVIEIAVDIGEVKKLKEQLTTAQDHLASLGMLLASLSHGIKGLLTALDGAVYDVDAGLTRGDRERTIRGWDAVKSLFARIKGMVLDILLCAKKREPSLQTVEIEPFAAQISEVVRQKAEEAGVALGVDFGMDLGFFEADPGLLAAALVNLLENAVDACTADKTKDGHEVRFGVRRQADKVVFEIADNGAGMDEATRAKLFHIFFSTKGSGGTGLGLYIAKLAVTGHGGALSVSSKPGEGSLFTASVPVKAPRRDQP
jgi:PAS domain S-box-containing protein